MFFVAGNASTQCNLQKTNTMKLKEECAHDQRRTKEGGSVERIFNIYFRESKN